MSEEEKPYKQGDSLTTLGENGNDDDSDSDKTEIVAPVEPEPEPEPVSDEPVPDEPVPEDVDLGETGPTEKVEVEENTEVPSAANSLIPEVSTMSTNADKNSRKRKSSSANNKKKKKSRKAIAAAADMPSHNTLKKIQKLEKEMKRLSLKVNKIRRHMPRCMR
jgi:hypothetical protein